MTRKEIYEKIQIMLANEKKTLLDRYETNSLDYESYKELVSKRVQEYREWEIELMLTNDDELPEKFDLKQMYEFEKQLAIQFPENKHIKDKIRQQLQILRDQNLIEFSARGQYRKIAV